MLLLGILSPFFKVPYDSRVIVVACDNCLCESFVKALLEYLDDTVLVNRYVGKVDKSFKLQDRIVKAVALFQFLEFDVCIALDICVCKCFFEFLFKVDPKTLIGLVNGWYPDACLVD